MLGLAGPASAPGPFSAKQTLLGLNAKDLYGAKSGEPAAQSPANVQPSAAAQPPAAAQAQAAQPAAAARAGFDPKRTLLGVGAPTPSSVPPAPANPASAVGRSTQLGHAPGERLSAPQLSSTAILHPGADRSTPAGTLLGMPSPAAAFVAQHGAAPAAPRQSATLDTTVLTGDNAATKARGSSPARGPAASLGQGTLLGVAAPTVSSQPDASNGTLGARNGVDDVTPAPGRSSAPPVISPAPPAPHTTDGGDPWQPHARRQRQSAAVLLGAAALVLVALIGFIAWWDPAPPLQVHLAADPSGAERLEFTCMDCPEGSQISFGDKRADFAGQTAVLAIDEPLAIGNNDIEVNLERGGMGRDELVSLSVPVHSRVQVDVTPLREGKTHVDVLVQARPDARVTLEDKAVRLVDGSARVPFELGDSIVGDSPANAHFEKTITYAVHDADEPLHEGSLLVRLPIVPLSLDTPRGLLITESERFMLAGRTAPGAQVSVAGSPIPVAADGSFAQLMSIDSVGETTITVRAFVDGHAPRLVRVEMKRVPKLADAAKTFGEPVDYAGLLAAATAGSERRVALDVQIDEARDKKHSSVLLGHLDSGCAAAPCLVQVHGTEPYRGKKGDTLRVFGVVSGRIDGPAGKPIPVVNTAFSLD